MNKKEAAKIKVAMDIIRENCESSASCEGCPFNFVCCTYRCLAGKIPSDWKELFQ